MIATRSSTSFEMNRRPASFASWDDQAFPSLPPPMTNHHACPATSLSAASIDLVLSRGNGRVCSAVTRSCCPLNAAMPAVEGR